MSMIGQPSVRTLVTNIARGGEYVVVQTIEIEYGGFQTRTEAEEFETQVAAKDNRVTAPPGTHACKCELRPGWCNC